MQSNFSFSHETIKGTITINTPEDLDDFHDEAGILNYNGLLEVLGELTDDYRLQERFRLGAERERLKMDKIAEKDKSKAGPNINSKSADDVNMIYSHEIDPDINDELYTCEYDEDGSDYNTGSNTDKKENKKPPRATEWILDHADGVKVIASTDDSSIKVYDNGYGVVHNNEGYKTVIWVPALKDFRFSKLDDVIKPDYDIDTDLLAHEAWYMIISICAEYQIEQNNEKRLPVKNVDRGESSERINDEENGRLYAKMDRAAADEDENKNYKYSPYHYDGPEKAYTKKETFCEIMDKLTDRQRNVVIAYHIGGFCDEEVADCLHITRQAVQASYQCAAKKINSWGLEFLEINTDLAHECGKYIDQQLFVQLFAKYGGDNGKSNDGNNNDKVKHRRPGRRKPKNAY